MTDAIQWQSMFDAGACKISVTSNGVPGQAYNEILGKGQTSETFSLNDNASTVSVDANGVVTLDCANPISGVELDVFPQYDVSALKTQMTAISAFFAENDKGTAWSNDPIDPGTTLAFDASTGIATPATVTYDPYTPLEPGACVGVETQNLV